MSGDIKSDRVKRLSEVGKKLKEEFIKQNKTGEVLIEEKEGQFFVGYTKNYIKCYLQDDSLSVGDIVTVKIESPYKEGAKASILN